MFSFGRWPRHQFVDKRLLFCSKHANSREHSNNRNKSFIFQMDIQNPFLSGMARQQAAIICLLAIQQH